MSKKRAFSTFSLSFLDIMSCGLGAVALVFLIFRPQGLFGEKIIERV